MSSLLLPEGEATRRAVKWVSSELKSGSKKGILHLVNEACVLFNLSPADSIILENAFKNPEKCVD